MFLAPTSRRRRRRRWWLPNSHHHHQRCSANQHNKNPTRRGQLHTTSPLNYSQICPIKRSSITPLPAACHSFGLALIVVLVCVSIEAAPKTANLIDRLAPVASSTVPPPLSLPRIGLDKYRNNEHQQLNQQHYQQQYQRSSIMQPELHNLVKTPRMATYLASCPPEVSIHPCTCIYHTPSIQEADTVEDPAEEETYFEINPQVTTPYAEPLVMASSSTTTASPTTTSVTAPTTTTPAPLQEASTTIKPDLETKKELTTSQQNSDLASVTTSMITTETASGMSDKENHSSTPIITQPANQNDSKVATDTISNSTYSSSSSSSSSNDNIKISLTSLDSTIQTKPNKTEEPTTIKPHQIVEESAIVAQLNSENTKPNEMSGVGQPEQPEGQSTVKATEASETLESATTTMATTTASPMTSISSQIVDLITIRPFFDDATSSSRASTTISGSSIEVSNSKSISSDNLNKSSGLAESNETLLAGPATDGMNGAPGVSKTPQASNNLTASLVEQTGAENNKPVAQLQSSDAASNSSEPSSGSSATISTPTTIEPVAAPLSVSESPPLSQPASSSAGQSSGGQTNEPSAELQGLALASNRTGRLEMQETMATTTTTTTTLAPSMEASTTTAATTTPAVADSVNSTTASGAEPGHQSADSVASKVAPFEAQHGAKASMTSLANTDQPVSLVVSPIAGSSLAAAVAEPSPAQHHPTAGIAALPPVAPYQPTVNVSKPLIAVESHMQNVSTTLPLAPIVEARNASQPVGGDKFEPAATTDSLGHLDLVARNSSHVANSTLAADLAKVDQSNSSISQIAPATAAVSHVVSIGTTAQLQHQPTNGTSSPSSTNATLLAATATQSLVVPTFSNITHASSPARRPHLARNSTSLARPGAAPAERSPSPSGRAMHSRHTNSTAGLHANHTSAPAASHGHQSTLVTNQIAGHQPAPAHRQSAPTRSQLLTPNGAGRRPATGHNRLHHRPSAGAVVSSSTPASSGPTSSEPAARLHRVARYLASDAYHFVDSGEPKVEILAYCRNIRNAQVLRDAIKGFRGHQINYFVIENSKVPSFPNDLFEGVDVRWLEMANSTVQFHDNYLRPRRSSASSSGLLAGARARY